MLVTNDVANLKLAQTEGLHALTVRQYIRSVEDKFPALLELVAATVDTVVTDDGSVGDAGAPSSAVGVGVGGVGPTMYYSAHLPMSKIQEGLKSGKLRSGVIRMSRDSWSDGSVLVNLPDGDQMSVVVSSKEHVNRATEVRSHVMIAVAPLARAGGWGGMVRDGLLTTLLVLVEQGDTVAVELLPSTASKSASGVSPPVHGRVVGIVKRAWRPLCGSLQPADGAFARYMSKRFFLFCFRFATSVFVIVVLRCPPAVAIRRCSAPWMRGSPRSESKRDKRTAWRTSALSWRWTRGRRRRSFHSATTPERWA